MQAYIRFPMAAGVIAECEEAATSTLFQVLNAVRSRLVRKARPVGVAKKRVEFERELRSHRTWMTPVWQAEVAAMIGSAASWSAASERGSRAA
ncbi:MAG: hypothetical protein HY329_18340 [Chloroflexi bacterium]|nr:hypothetical protein [Chloroflexota bacterium]